MSEPNVVAFCHEIVRQHKKLIDCPEPSLQLILTAEIQETDLCFSDAIQSALESEWESDEHQNGIRAALDAWLEAVRDRLDGILGPSTLFPFSQVGVAGEEQAGLFFAVDLIHLNYDEGAMAALVAAASQSPTPD